MCAALEVRSTSVYGNGLFAREEIAKGSLLVALGGYVLTLDEEKALPESLRDIAIQIAPNLVLGILDENQLAPTDYINHSCNPNSGIKGQISLFAIRDIQKGEQVTFDYGTVLYRNCASEKYVLKCLCGSAGCRGEVTSDDWKNLDLQKKYKGYFSHFLEEKINGGLKE